MYFESDKLQEVDISDYIILCRACTEANCTPLNWKCILQKMKSIKFSCFFDKFEQFDWLQFAIDLNKLDYCDITLLQKIINSKTIQSKKFYDQSKIENLKKILEHENMLCNKTDKNSDFE